MAVSVGSVFSGRVQPSVDSCAAKKGVAVKKTTARTAVKIEPIEVEDDEASTTSTKTTHEVTSFRRNQDKKQRERVLPPTIVSLNPGGKRQNSKSKKAGNQKKGN